MKSRVENSISLHKKQYNCAQAVICNYADLVGLSEETAFKISEGFGGGVGMKKEVCGAVSGLTMVASMALSSGDVEIELTKGKTYKTVASLMDEFKEKNSSYICREILGGAGSPKLRSCNGCIADACQIIEERIFEGKFEKFEGEIP